MGKTICKGLQERMSDTVIDHVNKKQSAEQKHTKLPEWFVITNMVEGNNQGKKR